MALGTTIGQAGNDYSTGVVITDPFTPWMTIRTGGVSARDHSATITKPLSQITTSKTFLFWRNAPGRYLDVRVGYTSSTTSLTTSPQVQAFGRHDANDPWTALFTAVALPAQTATLAVVVNDDVEHGTKKYTKTTSAQGRFSALGFRQYLVGVRVGLVTNADDSKAILQARFSAG